jgi:hypothetical protein
VDLGRHRVEGNQVMDAGKVSRIWYHRGLLVIESRLG